MPKTELLRDVVDVLALLCRPCTWGSMKTKHGNVSWVGRFQSPVSGITEGKDFLKRAVAGLRVVTDHGRRLFVK